MIEDDKRGERSSIEVTVSNLQTEYSWRTHLKFFPSFIIYTVYTLLPLCNYSLSLSMVRNLVTKHHSSYFFRRFLSPVLILSEHEKSVLLPFPFALFRLLLPSQFLSCSLPLHIFRAHSRGFTEFLPLSLSLWGRKGNSISFPHHFRPSVQLFFLLFHYESFHTSKLCQS